MVREAPSVKRQTWSRNVYLCALALGSVLSAEQAFTFKIVTPADGATLKSGQTVTARVDLGADSGIVKVRYYWYGELAETLVQQDDSDASIMPQQDRLSGDRFSQKDSISGAPVVAVAALSSSSDQTPPFGGIPKIPKEAVSGTALVAAQRRFLIEPDSPTGISLTSRAPGLWVSPRAAIHPQARLVAPAYVGRNVVVAAGATIAPGAVVLEDCTIGGDTEVAEALVLPKTLVGPALTVRNAILNGDRYLHTALETTIKVSDPGLVAPLAGRARRACRVPTWQRLLAAALWPACLPWPLYRIARGRWPDPPQQDKEALFRQQAGAWQRHFANVVVPRLGMVVAGRAGLTGLELREGTELRRLDADWGALYASRPMGLVSESLLVGVSKRVPPRQG